MPKNFSRSTIVLVTTSSLLAGCSGDPDQQKRTYLESAQRYAGEGKHAEAAIEFRNVLQIDPASGEAQEGLAHSLYEAGDPENAARALVRASDLLAERADLQLKAGELLLLSGRFDDARVRADKVLALNPKDISAQILKANALAGMKDLESALAEVEQAVALDPTYAPSFTALGAVQLARGESAAAEEAFLRAVAVAPASAQAHLALGNFYWTGSRVREAEASFSEALRLEPRNPLANRALATFYMASNRAPEAERFLTVLAEDGRGGSPRLSLADYYATLRRFDDAIKVLEQLSSDRIYRTDATLRIASIRYLQGDAPQAYSVIDGVLENNPASIDALLMKARLLLADGKPADALPLATRAADADPGAAAALYVLGLAHSQLHHGPEAQRAFGRVLEINPRAVAARVRLADIELRRGNAAASVQHALDAVTRQPQNVIARLLLAKSYLAEANADGAERELRTLAATYPNWGTVHTNLGLVFMRRQNLIAARQAFESALKLDGRDGEALAGLIALDIREGRHAEARALIDSRLAADGGNPATQLMAARAYAMLRDTQKAEAILTSLIERDPSNLQAFSDLAQLYLAQGRLDQARASFEQVADREPSAVAANTMVGIILQVQNRTADAITRYEQVLAVDRESAVAANNLAWLYAEQGVKLETAVELARSAKRVLPGRAEVSDTLGFVYLKKNAPDLAIPAMREAVAQEPENPRYRLRLGVALARVGRIEEARREIDPVLRGNPNVPEAVEARAALNSSR